MFKKLLLILIMFVTFELLVTFVRIYSADVAYEMGDRYLVAGQTSKALELANQSVALNSNEPNYYRGRARILVTSLTDVSPKRASEVRSLIQKDLNKAYEINPHNLVTMRNLVPLYAYLASKDITSAVGVNNLEPAYLGVTQDFYNKINDYSPNDVGVYALLAKYNKRLGFDAKYKYNIDRVKELRPDLLDWFVN